jgi:hypothetical protein
MGFTRWVVYAVAVSGIAATARFAVAPPRAEVPKLPRVDRPDRAAEGFATLFARRYLTWNAARTDAYAQQLVPFLGDRVDVTAGVRLPGSGAQSVEWAEVAQARDAGPGEHVYTVAAQTDSVGVLYLAVDVARDATGSLRLAAYPALVGAPSMRPAGSFERGGFTDVTNSTLTTVVDRALRNYLAGSWTNLAADVTADARITLPPLSLAIRRVESLQWTPDHSGVVATVVANDPRNVTYTLSYAVDVTRVGARWELGAIEMDPST